MRIPGLQDRPDSNKKRTIILLRSVVAISTGYLILFDHPGLNGVGVLYILALIISNLVLAVVPGRVFHNPRFSAALLLVDTAMVLAGLYLTVGCFSQDFLIIYFFTIFLTTATESLTEIALGAAIVSGVYGYWLWLTSGHALGSGEWLRLPFFFIVAVFYAYMTEETKEERRRRQQAQRESEHLRFLLRLGDAFAQRTAHADLAPQAARVVAAAFPRLSCRVHDDVASDVEPGGVLFPIAARGRRFGALDVTAKDGGALRPEEEQFCRVVALVMANALYTAEQVDAAQDGARLKDEFLATLSHELRSPLHVILGNADILSDVLNPTPGELVCESLDRLRANACHLQDLIEAMLCFAELRAGKDALLVAGVELREIFGECEVIARQQLAGRDIRFESAVAADVPDLRTDRRKLRLIVSGLLSNAVKFTEKGFVRLTAERTSPHEIEIAVHDSGIGIHLRDLTRIFEGFRQLDASLSRRFGGLGLGLALAHELSVRLGGRLEVESEPNRGSVFRVRLPIDIDSRPATAAVAERSTPERAVLAALPDFSPATR